ncbi:MAG TPA: dTMP kinase [Thermofilum sp.]|nr:dTMP kinase [Thermofilum sp.]
MPLFIVFEGIDGAGLTTHATLTEKFLQRMGFKVLLTKEPTDGLIGGLIRAALRKEWTADPATLQLLFAADRSRHVKKVIKPALKKGVHVISDRYLFSSLAYGSLNLSVEWLKTVNSPFPLPDITFLLDISPEEAVKRIKGERFAVELFEEIEKLSKVRKAFLQLAEQYPNFFILKTDDEVEEVQRKIEEIILQKMDEQQ